MESICDLYVPEIVECFVTMIMWQFPTTGGKADPEIGDDGMSVFWQKDLKMRGAKIVWVNITVHCPGSERCVERRQRLGWLLVVLYWWSLLYREASMSRTMMCLWYFFFATSVHTVPPPCNTGKFCSSLRSYYCIVCTLVAQRRLYSMLVLVCMQVHIALQH